MIGRRLPLLLALRRAVEWPLERWRTLLPATLLLGLVNAVCFALTLSAVTIDDAGVVQSDAKAAPLVFGSLLLMAVVSLSYGLGLYRCVLLDEPRHGFGLFLFDRRLLTALGLGMRMTGIGVGLLLAATLLAHVVGGGLTLPMFALFAYLMLAVPRLRLAFAAAALDEEAPTLRDAWRRTRGDAAAVVVGVVAVYLVLTMAQNLVGRVPFLQDDLPAFLFAGLFAALQSCLSVVFVALAYDALVRNGAPEIVPTLH